IRKFSIGRLHKGGAKFDYEKAKWFNHEWIKQLPVTSYQLPVKKIFEENEITIDNNEKFVKVLELVKDRCTLLTDFLQQASYFFQSPETIDIAAVKPKWNEQKQLFFTELIYAYRLNPDWRHDQLEKEFKE